MAKLLSIDPKNPYYRRKKSSFFEALWYAIKGLFREHRSFKISFLALALLISATPTITNSFLTQYNEAQETVSADLFLVVTSGSPNTTSVSLYERSCSAPITSIKASFAYPSSKVTVQNIDTSRSAFSEEDQNLVMSGLADIERTATDPVLGTQLIATVTFSSTQPVSDKDFSISPNSSIIATNHSNIFKNSMVVSSISNITAGSSSEQSCSSAQSPKTDASFIAWLNSHLYTLFSPLFVKQ